MKDGKLYNIPKIKQGVQTGKADINFKTSEGTIQCKRTVPAYQKQEEYIF